MGVENDSEAYLSDENNHDEEETEPRSIDTTDSVEGDLVQGVAVIGPGFSESNVGQADGTPGEQGGETRKSKEPVEDDGTLSVQVDIGEGTKENDDADGGEGATTSVNVAEELGSIALLGQGSQSSGTTVHGRNTNGQDGDEDYNVHEVIEALETGIFTHKDERRGLGIGVSALGEQGRIVSVDEEADKEEAEDIEEGNSPEYLLDSTRERPGRVVGLGSSETDEFGSGERKGSRDKNGAEALEAVLEGTGFLVPVTGTPVLVVATALGTTTEDKDESDDHENDGRNQFKGRRPKFFLGIAKSAKEIDDDDGDEEDGDPDSWRGVCVPVLDSDGTDGKFERKDDGPLEDVIPTHGETP